MVNTEALKRRIALDVAVTRRVFKNNTIVTTNKCNEFSLDQPNTHSQSRRYEN